VVSSLEDFVADPQTQQAVAEYIDSALCSSLPSEFASMCTQVGGSGGGGGVSAVKLPWIALP
jgi:hypothetical protein